MKTRFSTLDIGFELKELETSMVGMRLNRVYDIDHKTYLLKLQKPQGGKSTLLLESGIRLHTTRFEWPKNDPPSGFTMKLRKHLVNKRLESVRQLGVDRVVDLKFGSEEAAHHLILELYDRGNMVLTDHNFTILNILRPRVQGEDKFLARENYPVDNFKKADAHGLFTPAQVKTVIFGASQSPKSGTTTLKKILLPFFDFGPAFLEHLLFGCNLNANMKIKKLEEVEEEVFTGVCQVFRQASEFSFERQKPEGFIRQQKQQRLNEEGAEAEYFYRYQEFHPMRFLQHSNDDSDCVKTFQDFDSAVDEFFSSLEGQKIDAKAVQQEQKSIKKLENVKRDHLQRIDQLEKDQLGDRIKGELIEVNTGLVDRALNWVRTALANQMDWNEILELVGEGAENGDVLMSSIKGLKLEVNRMCMVLSDPYGDDNEEVNVELDIDLTAQANARKYYDKKRSAASKVVKTVQSQSLAIKSAEKRAKQVMRDVNVISRIVKQRKVFWFEKFLWFISSENYLVIAGRDQQQNELVVKRYLGSNDVYVHAEVQGASSVVIKNPSGGGQVPPKTLHEAGQMALCYSVAWDSKVVISAYWVNGSQVSKSAPTGEYLTAGSFMIRGKKNFLPPSQLALGFGFMFKLDEDSIERHKDERRVKMLNEDEVETVVEQEEEVDQEVEDSDEGKSSPPPEKEAAVEFPDTELKLNFSSGKGLAVELVRSESESERLLEPVVVVDKKMAAKGTEEQQPLAPTEDGRQKRGKRGKNKKLKEKYKDQDEEDKELAMQLLHKSTKEDSKKNRKKQEKLAAEERKRKNQELAKQRMIRNQTIRMAKSRKDDDDVVGDGSGGEEQHETRGNADSVDMLDSLTGCPLPEDNILFAVPVVCPYSTMINYKYKVKITPGSSKRGKAAKTALNVFLNDKSGSQRDKDMLKSVKEQDNARNLPGKVKVSSLLKK